MSDSNKLSRAYNELRRPFDPEGSDYDYTTAKAAGMGPDGTGDNEGHWGSVTQTSRELRAKYNLPEESYIVLKGRAHPTWSYAVEGEAERGFKIKKYGDRYFSVPGQPSKPRKSKLPKAK